MLIKSYVLLCTFACLCCCCGVVFVGVLMSLAALLVCVGYEFICGFGCGLIGLLILVVGSD